MKHILASVMFICGRVEFCGAIFMGLGKISE
jgi:hypothetical protein